jgi:hypothetical protein
MIAEMEASAASVRQSLRLAYVRLERRTPKANAAASAASGYSTKFRL